MSASLGTGPCRRCSTRGPLYIRPDGLVCAACAEHCPACEAESRPRVVERPPSWTLLDVVLMPVALVSLVRFMAHWPELLKLRRDE